MIRRLVNIHNVLVMFYRSWVRTIKARSFRTRICWLFLPCACIVYLHKYGRYRRILACWTRA
jgi:hypothetical protein